MDNKEIGTRLMKLRKSKEISQAELAETVGLSRSSMVQVEAGKRSVSTTELLEFSKALQFSLDDFLSPNFSVFSEVESLAKAEKVVDDIRVAVPKLNVEKFKNIILYILEECGGKPNIGETMLYKLLYFSDFNYYELYEEHLSGAIYKKLQFGPVPQRLDGIINQMIKDKLIKRVKTEYHNYPQTRYLSLENADLKSLSAAEKEVIDKVIEQFSDWSAARISDYSHKDMPWKATKDGEVIDYELAFYRETPFSVRNYDESE